MNHRRAWMPGGRRGLLLLELEWRAIDPWTGYLAEDGGCPALRVPFLPGTAPLLPCTMQADTSAYLGGEDLDSLYWADSLAIRDREDEEGGTGETSAGDTLAPAEPDSLAPSR